MRALFLLPCFIMLTCFSKLFAQSFEGIVTYKMTIKNPNTQVVSDSTFFANLANDSVRIVTYFYQNNQYKSKDDLGTVVQYHPETESIYFYGDETSALVINESTTQERITERTQEDKGVMILNQPCKKVTFVNQRGAYKSYWYSNEYFLDASFYTKHNYGHWKEFTEISQSIPLKMEFKSFIVHVVYEAIAIKKKCVRKKHFILPDFESTEPGQFMYGSFNLYGQK